MYIHIFYQNMSCIESPLVAYEQPDQTMTLESSPVDNNHHYTPKKRLRTDDQPEDQQAQDQQSNEFEPLVDDWIAVAPDITSIQSAFVQETRRIESVYRQLYNDLFCAANERLHNRDKIIQQLRDQLQASQQQVAELQTGIQKHMDSLSLMVHK